MSLMTFIVIIVLGALWGHHAPADTTGPAFNSLGNYPKTTTNVPVTQVGINGLASDVGHLGVSINFTWTLITGFLVLFMQVGFAFLVTGLTRAKNAGHMMMMNIAAFAVALIAYYAVGFAFHFGGVAPVANLGGLSPLSGLFPHGNAGLIGTHGFFLQSSHGYDVGVIAMFLFQVVFMETAGYIIIGAIAERISFAGFLVAAMAYTNAKYGKPDISMSCNGMLAGLVAITAGCAFVAPWAASVIGMVAGFLVCYGVWFFDHVAHVDDPCGAISVHGLNGAWGVLAVGIFADGTYGSGWNGVNGNVTGLLYGDGGQL